MTEYRLPGGGRAWFVRRRTATSYQLNPCAPAGWWLTIAFCLFVSVVPTAVLLAGSGPQSTVRWVAFGALLMLPTIGFVVAAFRLSVPERRD